MNAGESQVSLFFIIFIFIPLFFLPTYLAIKKNHLYKIPIILINVFGGLFFGAGWLIALVWVFVEPQKKTHQSIGVADEIQKLNSLREEGVITQEEFDRKKNSLILR